MEETNYDCIIIGAGMSGLTCGAWLAKQGKKVLVLEHNLKSGGLCSTFHRAGFNFNPAVSMFSGMEHGTLGKTLEALGIKDNIEAIPINPFIKMYFPEHTISLPTGITEFQNELSSHFPHEAKNIARCVAKMEKLYTQLDEVKFLGTNFFNPLEFIGLYTKVVFPRPGIVWATFQSVSTFLNSYLKYPKLISMLDSLSHFFMGAAPSKTAVLPFICFLMSLVKDGCYYIKGGPQVLVDALENSIRNRGGEVLFQAEVEKIIIEDNKACGVQTVDGREFKAPNIVSNADAKTTLLSMVGKDNLNKWYLKWFNRFKVSPSFFMTFLGLNTDLKEKGFIPAMYVYSPSYTYVEDFYQDVEGKMFSEEGSFSLPLLSLSDPASAPEGMNAVTIETLGIPYKVNPGWETSKNQMMDTIIKRVEKGLIPELSSYIVLKEAGGPLTVEKYIKTYEGTACSWEDTIFQSGIFRMNQTNPIKNLFLTGQGSKPGGGVGGTLLSGLQVAKRILEKEKMDSGLSVNDFTDK